MDIVKKVSIGGFAFSLEDNAYEIIEEYLDKIQKHYESKPSGSEIFEGIEGRLAELLIDRCGRNGLVSESIARKCVDTIGMPEDFEDGTGRTAPASVNKAEKKRKKLFRNSDDMVISGVLGGLGVFFGIDPLVFRLAMAALLAVSAFTADGFWNPGTVALVYLILWVSIPEARTTEDRLAMRGEECSPEEIEKHISETGGVRKHRNGLGVLARVFMLCMGALFLLTGLCGIVVLFAALLGLTVAGTALSGLTGGILALAVGGPEWMIQLLKIFGALSVSLPFLLMAYAGVKFLFNISSPRWKPGLWIFILWLISLVVFILLALALSTKYSCVSKKSEAEEMTMSGDTLFVRFEDIDRWKDAHVIANGTEREYHLVYFDRNEGDSFDMAVFPNILRRDSDGDSKKVSVRSSRRVFNTTKTPDHIYDREGDFVFDKDTLILSPQIYHLGSPVKSAGTNIVVSTPPDVKIFVKGPLEHHFDKEFHCSDLEINGESISDIIEDILWQ